MKTLLECFDELPYPLNEMAIENTLDQGRNLEMEETLLTTAIGGIFNWDKTKQTADFWKDIHTDLCEDGYVTEYTLSKYSSVIEEYIRGQVVKSVDVETKPTTIDSMIFLAYLDGVSDVHRAYGDQPWVEEIEYIKRKFKELYV